MKESHLGKSRYISTLSGVAVVMACVAAFLSGCDLLAVKEQHQLIGGYCQLSGSVRPEKTHGNKMVVVLLKFKGGDFKHRDNWSLFDHFVNDGPGKWYFSTSPGNYLVTAFEDVNGDSIFQPDEPAIAADPQNLLQCAAGETKTGIELMIHEQGRFNANAPVDISKTQVRTSRRQLDISLGQVVKTAEIVRLDEPRFADEIAKQGMWRPFDFLIDGHAGLYFLEPYAAEKIPVLFVHGINGTPRNFAYLTEHMDRAHFQPWLFYYPSGAHLENIAKRLQQMVQQLQNQYRFKKLVVVAHSMGGLVARNFILKNSESADDKLIPLFISIATPWDGHAAAKLGAEHLSNPVYSWEDMAPGSPYLTNLFYASTQPQAQRRMLPKDLAYHLLFAFIDQESGDGTVSLASELKPEAQEEATHLYGYQKSHTQILTAAEMLGTVNRLLAGVR